MVSTQTRFKVSKRVRSTEFLAYVIVHLRQAQQHASDSDVFLCGCSSFGHNRRANFGAGAIAALVLKATTIPMILRPFLPPLTARAMSQTTVHQSE